MKIQVTIDLTTEQGRSQRRLLNALNQGGYLSNPRNGHSFVWQEYEDKCVITLVGDHKLAKLWDRWDVVILEE
jgi:hypothetical protein